MMRQFEGIILTIDPVRDWQRIGDVVYVSGYWFGKGLASQLTWAIFCNSLDFSNYG